MPTVHEEIVDHNRKTLTTTTSCNFSEDVFEKEAKFQGTTFKEKTDFSKAVFHGFADFSEAKFLGDADFSDAVFLAGASFEKAQFGAPYKSDFGGWSYRFQPLEEAFGLSRTRKDETGKVEWENLGQFVNHGQLSAFLARKGDDADIADKIIAAYNTFSKNPVSVSFKSCRFGDMTEESKKEQTSPKSADVNFKSADFYNQENVSFDSAKFVNAGSVTFKSARFANGGRVEFDSAKFVNAGSVTFKSASFANGEWVRFYSTRFTNAGRVEFGSVLFANAGRIEFDYANFANAERVMFDFASFANERGVTFWSVRFANKRAVTFKSANFASGRGVGFDYTSFANGGGGVSFKSARFEGKNPIHFSKALWAHDGFLDFSNVMFTDTLNVAFLDCLFLCKKKKKNKKDEIGKADIDFRGTRFPKEGSTMFQRCYFAGMERVDFSGAYFRHTTFDGGEMEWVYDKEKKESEEYKKRLSELPEATRERINELKDKDKDAEFAHVFHPEVKVLWEDLTAESARHLTFRLVDFSGSIFNGMTPSLISLNASEWRSYKGRKILYEEQRLRDEGKDLYFKRNKRRENLSSWKNLKDQYTQFKTNLEKQGEYQSTGEFHYGEQEVQRLILFAEKSFFVWFLNWIYKWASGYGERPLRSVGALFGVLLAFVILLTWINGDLNKATAQLDWKLTKSVWIRGGFTGTAIDCESIKLIVKALFKTSVRAITPLSWKDTFSSPTSASDVDRYPWFYALLILAQILLAVQLSLLVMAVRRRFKR